MQAHTFHFLSRHFSHAMKFFDGKLFHKNLNFRGANKCQTIGFPYFRSYFSNKLIDRNSGRSG